MKKRYKYENNVLKIYIKDKWNKVDIQDYEIKDVINSGANGVVLKGIHKITNRVDAIKIWLPNKTRDKKEVSLEQYLNEIRKVASLRNNNIVTIYDAKILSEGIYMSSMEYINGKSLAEWLEKNKNIFNRIVLCKKILKTIIEYQEKGMIHGDLHCGNIIIDKNDEIYIIDFGTSLFSHNNQSKERESYFVVDLVKKLLGEYYISDCLEFRNYSLRGKITHKDDSRCYAPVLITKTLAYYVELASMKVYELNLEDSSILSEYCRNVSKGIYFDLNAVVINTLSWNREEILQPLLRGIFENIQSTLFDIDDSYECEDIEFCTLYVYYDIFFKYKDKIDFTKAEKDFNKGRIAKDLNFIKDIKDLKHCRAISYIEYHKSLEDKINDLDIIREIDTRNRMLLAEALASFYGEKLILILYKIWQRINEIRLDKKLHNEILQLSNIIKEKGWKVE